MTNRPYKSHNGNGSSGEEFKQKDGSKPLVLVVDDDTRILSFVRVSLKLAGYDVITATCGEEALRLVDLERPDVMLLDILMSPMDGFEVLRRLRTKSELPVIAVSAHTSATDDILGLGANDFLSKPFRPEELQKKIKALLDHKS